MNYINIINGGFYMIELLYRKIFLLLVLIIFSIGLMVPMIIIRKKGKDSHGTHEGYSILARLSSATIFIWIINIVLFIFFYNLIELFWRFTFLSGDLFIIIGMISIAIGTIVEILGMYSLGINFRIELPKEETELITSGIYRVMRNPIAFGLFLIIGGTFLLIPNVLTLIITIANIIVFDAKVRDEEKFLLARFGKPYEEYQNKVGRYFPFAIN
ncbi:MAG: isoprenylcysteine carboxylmethyltransferase family protein [Promethearchaeota archaeon]|nr:MAG: isoprenylcysteine carboxylmethyltransferase family protein [Candidatus Lokiarchaeota archaeon]